MILLSLKHMTTIKLIDSLFQTYFVVDIVCSTKVLAIHMSFYTSATLLYHVVTNGNYLIYSPSYLVLTAGF